MACACSLKTTHKLQLKAIGKYGEDAFSFDFGMVSTFKWHAGDYTKWFVNIDGDTVGQKYSFATLPSEDLIRFTLRIPDEHSDYKHEISKLRVGDKIEVSDPVEDFKLVRNYRPALMISNGVGIATIRSLLRAYFEDTSDIPSVTQINVDSKSHIYQQEFEAYERQHAAFKSFYVPHRESFYDTLHHEIVRLSNVFDIKPLVYVVGSYQFGESVSAFLKSEGFEDEDIYRDGQAKGKGNCSCATVNRSVNILFDLARS